jgi:3-(3-hydroxy-phenyl)propionate hydroxylase
MPPLRGGLFSDTPGAGELFPQPMVTVGTGPWVRLDDVLPSVTVVLTTATDAVGLGAPVVEVAPPLALGSDAQVQSGAALPDWFTARNATYAVVRPDRYVHGTASTADAAAALAREISPAGQPAQP